MLGPSWQSFLNDAHNDHSSTVDMSILDSQALKEMVSKRKEPCEGEDDDAWQI
jgi:hypothetical protein